MFERRRFLGGLATVLAMAPQAASGQVAEIQVLPAELNLEVGEQGTVIATLFPDSVLPDSTSNASLALVSRIYASVRCDASRNKGFGTIDMVTRIVTMIGTSVFGLDGIVSVH